MVSFFRVGSPSMQVCVCAWAHFTHTHLFNGPLSGLPRWAGTRKVKPIWILLKQETVSGSDISWAICKSTHRSRQITMPAPPLSYLQAGCPSCRPTNSVIALEAWALNACCCWLLSKIEMCGIKGAVPLPSGVTRWRVTVVWILLLAEISSDKVETSLEVTYRHSYLELCRINCHIKSVCVALILYEVFYVKMQLCSMCHTKLKGVVTWFYSNVIHHTQFFMSGLEFPVILCSEFDCSDLTSYFNLFLGVIYKISYDFLMRLSQVYHKINIG